MSLRRNILIYDGECFYCSNYVRLLNIKAAIGDITLINAREVETVPSLGFAPSDLNHGIVFIFGDKQYFGADAIHHLALLSTHHSLFNTINKMIFRHRWLAMFLYPFMKAGRRLYLFLVGKKLID